MAGIVGIFAAIGDHIPVFKKEKTWQPSPEGYISQYHYRGTFLAITALCILVTCTEWIAGSDSLINCLHQGPIPENVINNYCYIMGTFLVPKHLKFPKSHLGNSLSQPGVGPYIPYVDFIEVKAYYQWVPFMLFLQAVMFYIPHIIFKECEGGKILSILCGLSRWILVEDDRTSKYSELAKYIVEMRGQHRYWCLKLLLAQSLYLINVLGQIFFTDCFLGYEFSLYGFSTAGLLNEKNENRVDPMSRVFPKITKCTFRKFGPSGTIQRHDAQCVLPINIINEKIYVFLWFWFCILTVLTFINLLWSISIVFMTRVRRIIIVRKLRMSPKRKEISVDVKLMVDSFDFGDWKLFYHLLRNMDSLTFGEFCEYFCKELRDEKCSLDECIGGVTMSDSATLQLRPFRHPPTYMFNDSTYREEDELIEKISQSDKRLSRIRNNYRESQA